jgi:hypothetical protein
MNRIQFQHGLSMPEFFERYGTEAQCQAALQAARWPRGFVCPKCGGAARTQPGWPTQCVRMVARSPRKHG